MICIYMLHMYDGWCIGFYCFYLFLLVFIDVLMGGALAFYWVFIGVSVSGDWLLLIFHCFCIGV